MHVQSALVTQTITLEIPLDKPTRNCAYTKQVIQSRYGPSSPDFRQPSGEIVDIIFTQQENI